MAKTKKFGKNPKPENKNDEAQTYIFGGDNESSVQLFSSGRLDKKELEKYATQYGPVRRGLNLISSALYGMGYEIVGEDEELVKLCAESTINLTSHSQSLIKGIKEAHALGDGYIEIIWKNEDVDLKNGVLKKFEPIVLNYKLVDTKTVTPIWDEKGYVIYYEQKVSLGAGKTKIIKVPPEKILHIQFDAIADNVNGLGIIEPLAKTIKTLMLADNLTEKLLYRYAIPFTHITKIGAGKKDIKKLAAIAKQISSYSTFGSNEKYKIEFLTAKSNSDISKHIDLLQDTLAGGMGIPKPILFQAGETANRAVLTELNNYNREEFIYKRTLLSQAIREQIFKIIAEKNGFEEIPRIKWKILAVEQDAVRMNGLKDWAQTVKDLILLGVLTPEDVREDALNKLEIKAITNETAK